MAPLVPKHVAVADCEPPWAAFVEMAMSSFGMTREQAERHIAEAKAKHGRPH